MVAAVFSTIGEAPARGDHVSIAEFGTFTPRTRAPARAPLPALDQALEAVVALLSGAGRRGSVTARSQTPRPGASVRRLSAAPGGMRIALRPFRMSRLAPHTALHSSDSSMPSDAGARRGLPLPRCAVLPDTPP